MPDLGQLFDTSDFPPRWHCGTWSDLHGWTHVVADVATAAAYFAIPVVILVYLRRRPQAQFPSLFWLFALFILSCGSVHLIEATIFWQPWYRLSALAKVVTAVFSWGAVFALIRVFPRAMLLPELAVVNDRLLLENEQRRQAEEQLRKRNEELDEFTYVASHDLKAPLRAIGMLARWMEEDAETPLPDATQEHLDALRQRVRRLERLLEDLLQYSRVGRENVPAEEVDTGELARSVAELVVPAGRFEVAVAPDMPTVRAPRAAVEQVLLNLVSNAVKHHDRPTGRVTIGGAERAGAVELFVEDDGPGIPERFRERVFGMFQTLRPRDEVEGSGMGLSIVKKIVELHGGAVRLESTGERGTRCVVTWPALRNEEVLA